MERESFVKEIPLLAALPLLYRLVMSSANPKQFGLTKTQLIILSSLAVRGELRMSQVADFISSSKEQATRVVAALVDLGYVGRRHDEEKRTRVYVHLTDSGSAFVEQCREEFLKNLNGALNDRITPEEREELQTAAQSMTRILEKLR